MNARACVHRTTVHVCVECLCVTFPSFLRVYAKTQSEPMNGRRGHRNREVHCDGKMPTPSIFVSFYLPISRTYVSERRRRPLSSLMLLPLPYLHMHNVVVRLYSLIFPCQPFTLYIVVYAARCVCYTYTCPVCVCCVCACNLCHFVHRTPMPFARAFVCVPHARDPRSATSYVLFCLSFTIYRFIFCCLTVRCSAFYFVVFFFLHNIICFVRLLCAVRLVVLALSAVHTAPHNTNIHGAARQ